MGNAQSPAAAAVAVAVREVAGSTVGDGGGGVAACGDCGVSFRSFVVRGVGVGIGGVATVGVVGCGRSVAFGGAARGRGGRPRLRPLEPDPRLRLRLAASARSLLTRSRALS